MGRPAAGRYARPVRRRLEQRIFTQTLVIIEVFIALGDPEDALGSQGPLGVGDEEGIAGIDDTGIDGVDQTQGTILLPPQ